MEMNYQVDDFIEKEHRYSDEDVFDVFESGGWTMVRAINSGGGKCYDV